MSTLTLKALSKPYRLPFHTVRHISSPEDQINDRRIYVGTAPIKAILDLPTDENVRDYLLEAEGRIRKRPTQVHRAIRDTLVNNRQDFCVLNSGVTVVARECEIDEKSKCLLIRRPSIINGSQTQGVIRDVVKDLSAQSEDEVADLLKTHVKFEIIVTTDDELIADISIARNFQNDVMTISIAGRKGQLDELDTAIRKAVPGKKLKTSETKLSEDYVKTERLLQVIAALVPENLWVFGKEFNKVYTYSRKAQCLKQFQWIYENAKNPDSPDQESCEKLYQFYLDIAAEAFELHEKWKAHQGFQGTGLRALKRDGREIVEVPDGIVFPILAAHAAFVAKKKGHWTIDIPPTFSDDELIQQAKPVYMDMASSNPNVMGKSKGCYSSLYQIASIYKKLSK